MDDVVVNRGETKALTKVVTTPDQDPRLLGHAALLFGKEICTATFSSHVCSISPLAFPQCSCSPSFLSFLSKLPRDV